MLFKAGRAEYKMCAERILVGDLGTLGDSLERPSRNLRTSTSYCLLAEQP
jgi:hypothetical protein